MPREIKNYDITIQSNGMKPIHIRRAEGETFSSAIGKALRQVFSTRGFKGVSFDEVNVKAIRIRELNL